MMQIYYTSCRTGKSVGGSSGFQIRASSPNLPLDRLRSAIAYVGYSLPPSVIPTEKTYLTSPVRLAFLDTPDAGKLLCHGVYIGKDPMTGRFGNFFSHTLLNFPDNFQASEAIQTWGNRNWKKNDDDGNSNLEEIDFPADCQITIKEFTTFIKEETNKQMFEFLLLEVLTETEGRRIFVAAPSHEVALCVFGITQALPKLVIKRFTFSTYEADPLACGAKLIGTWLGDDADLEIPSSCFRGSNKGYNKCTGKKSEGQDTTPFTKYCISKMKSDQDFELVSKFRKDCEALEIDSVSLLNVFFNFRTNQPLPQKDILELLSREKIANWCIRSKRSLEILEKAFKESKENEDFHQKIYPVIGRMENKHPENISNNKDMGPELKTRIKSWAKLVSFMEIPVFDATSLKEISAGIKIDMEAKPKQKKALSQIIELIIGTMLQRKNDENSKIKSDLEEVFMYIGESMPKNCSKLYELFNKHFFKLESSYSNKTPLLESLIEIGLGNKMKHKDLDFSSFGNRLTSVVKKYLVNFSAKSGKKALWEIEKKTNDWDPDAKSRWCDITIGLIDRSSLTRKMFRWLGVVLVAGVVSWAFLDEIKFKHYTPLARFLRGCKYIVDFTKSQPSQPSQPKGGPAQKAK
ncbi:MAG: hypothetical protein EXS48_01750 [Candidatus Staskawiczbacteria bacterium]|nr:hypothetical protein [Candidatus Staskawiczbacteria bacterium]